MTTAFDWRNRAAVLRIAAARREAEGNLALTEMRSFEEAATACSLEADKLEGITANRPARDLTDAELIADFKKTGEAFDAARSGEGGGGSPGEWAYERCGELEQEMNRRKIPIPA